MKTVLGKGSLLILAGLLIMLLGCSSGKGHLKDKEEDCPKASHIIMLDDSDKA